MATSGDFKIPDITMCSGDHCPIRENCYRYKAEPTPGRQSYFSQPPWDGEKCDSFWQIEQERKLTPQEALDEMVRINEELGLYDDGSRK